MKYFERLHTNKYHVAEVTDYYVDSYAIEKFINEHVDDLKDVLKEVYEINESVFVLPDCEYAPEVEITCREDSNGLLFQFKYITELDKDDNTLYSESVDVRVDDDYFE